MHTKLTLRMKESLIETAKSEATRRGKSVSQMVGEYFSVLKEKPGDRQTLPPVTASLVGLMKGQTISEEAYKKHLRKKYS